jgi:hypothetical protein
VLVVGITGAAVAAPATAVKGTLEFTDYFFNWDGMVVDPASGDYVMAGDWMTYLVHGDLEGTYQMDVTHYGNINSPQYRFEGDATFTGTLKVKGSPIPIIWRAAVNGSGKMHAGYDFAGFQSWKSTVTTLGMKGQIAVHDRYGHGDGSDYSVYTGELK